MMAGGISGAVANFSFTQRRGEGVRAENAEGDKRAERLTAPQAFSADPRADEAETWADESGSAAGDTSLRPFYLGVPCVNQSARAVSRLRVNP